MRELTEEESWVIELARDYVHESRAGLKGVASNRLDQLFRAIDTLDEQWDGQWQTL